MTIPNLDANETFVPVGPISTKMASQIMALHGRKIQDMFVLFGDVKLPQVVSFTQSMGSLDDTAVVYDITFAHVAQISPNFNTPFTFGMNIGGGHSVRFDMMAVSMAVGVQLQMRFHFVPDSCRLVHTPQPATAQAFVTTVVASQPITSAMYGTAYTVAVPQFNAGTFSPYWSDVEPPAIPQKRKRAKPKRPKPPEPEPNLPKRAFAIGKKH